MSDMPNIYQVFIRYTWEEPGERHMEQLFTTSKGQDPRLCGLLWAKNRRKALSIPEDSKFNIVQVQVHQYGIEDPHESGYIGSRIIPFAMYEWKIGRGVSFGEEIAKLKEGAKA